MGQWQPLTCPLGVPGITFTGTKPLIQDAYSDTGVGGRKAIILYMGRTMKVVSYGGKIKELCLFCRCNGGGKEEFIALCRSVAVNVSEGAKSPGIKDSFAPELAVNKLKMGVRRPQTTIEMD